MLEIKRENSHVCIRKNMTLTAVQCLNSKGKNIINMWYGDLGAKAVVLDDCDRGAHGEKMSIYETEMTREWFSNFGTKCILPQTHEHVTVAMPKSDYSSISHKRKI